MIPDFLVPTRLAPYQLEVSYNPYKWPYKWVTWGITLLIGVITLLIASRGPPCTKGKVLDVLFFSRNSMISRHLNWMLTLQS